MGDESQICAYGLWFFDEGYAIIDRGYDGTVDRHGKSSRRIKVNRLR